MWGKCDHFVGEEFYNACKPLSRYMSRRDGPKDTFHRLGHHCIGYSIIREDASKEGSLLSSAGEDNQYTTALGEEILNGLRGKDKVRVYMSERRGKCTWCVQFELDYDSGVFDVAVYVGSKFYRTYIEGLFAYILMPCLRHNPCPPTFAFFTYKAACNYALDEVAAGMYPQDTLFKIERSMVDVPRFAGGPNMFVTARVLELAEKAKKTFSLA